MEPRGRGLLLSLIDYKKKKKKPVYSFPWCKETSPPDILSNIGEPDLVSNFRDQSQMKAKEAIDEKKEETRKHKTSRSMWTSFFTNKMALSLFSRTTAKKIKTENNQCSKANFHSRITTNAIHDRT